MKPSNTRHASTGYLAPPASYSNDASHSRTQSNVIQGSSAAGARALATQIVAFYFRAPVKAFFRTRVDYMQVARAVNPAVQAGAAWSWHQSTPGLLYHAVRIYGWSFIPRQVLPPLVANATVGAILYTSYLQALSALHRQSSQGTKRVYPPPPWSACFQAGFIAGAVQSAVAAPLDALVVRFKVADMLEGRYKSVFVYSRHKLSEIGLRGVFAGYGISFAKEAFGYGVFFASFEWVKQQAYFKYLRWYYGGKQEVVDGSQGPVRPHLALEPAFLLLAGASASIAQQIVQHPLVKIQDVHYGRLESIDYVAKVKHRHSSALEEYRDSYKKTWKQCAIQAKNSGGWLGWLYRGIAMNTLRQIPSTSAGLIVFELVRRRFGDASEGVHIEFEGRGILL